jgi:hypothetical protein
MKRLAVIFLVALAWAPPSALRAGPVETLEEVLAKCGDKGERGCADALWAFIDVTADDRLSLAELTRFFRITSEAASRDQPKPAEEGDLPALGGAFLSGPIAARLVVSNYDYDDDGAITKSELYHDLTGEQFNRILVEQGRTLPRRVGQVLMRVLRAPGAPAE